MSVADELQTLNDNILAAYTSVGDKGGTVPTDKNTNNLATAIDSIPSGGSGPLDPQVVYQQTRPTDWLPMPTPANNEIYLLVQVPAPMQEKDPGIPLAFLCQTSAGQYQVELGTMTNGEFVADSTYTVLVNSDTKYTNCLYYADWTDNPMDDGTHQVMVKISAVSGNITSFDHAQNTVGRAYGDKNTLEFKGRGSSITTCKVGSEDTSDYMTAMSMRFFSLEGTNSISTNFSHMFDNCRSLTAIPALDTSSGTDFSYMFNNCSSLDAIPQLDTSSGTDFSYMFCDCHSLTAIPVLDTSSGTNFSYMFQSCYSLSTIPQLNTSSGTNFSRMFDNCRSLTAIPALNTSSGTNFSRMFQSCYSLSTIPQLNTSSGTNFASMFYHCYSLAYINFVGYDFTGVTAANSRPTNTYANGGSIMRIDSNFQMDTGGFTGAVIASPEGTSSSTPFYILTEDETAMIPLGANATTVFTTDQYTYVVVPDSMYATYAADTYWSTLGTRLKKRSEVTLPDWYTT